MEFDYTFTHKESLNFSATMTETVSMTQLSSSLQLVDAFLGSNIAWTIYSNFSSHIVAKNFFEDKQPF